MEELKKAFRPEFLNRVDDIIVFHKLSQEEIRQIAVRMLENLKERMESLGVDIEFTPQVIDAVAKAGFDPVYGARPLKRAIQSKIEDALSGNYCRCISQYHVLNAIEKFARREDA